MATGQRIMNLELLPLFEGKDFSTLSALKPTDMSFPPRSFRIPIQRDLKTLYHSWVDYGSKHHVGMGAFMVPSKFSKTIASIYNLDEFGIREEG